MVSVSLEDYGSTWWYSEAETSTSSPVSPHLIKCHWTSIW